jgi:tetratricopeptide (TPR) repeat protein
MKVKKMANTNSSNILDAFKFSNLICGKFCFSILWGIPLLVGIISCSAAGVPYTDDPRKKLINAYELSEMGRFLPAERFANEALESFEGRGDKIGQADVYHFLGGLYKGEAYRKYANLLKKNNLPYDPTNATSIKNYKLAIEIWYQINDLNGVAKSKFEMGNAYGLDGNMEMQCLLFRESLSDYKAGKSHPSSQSFIIRNPHFSNFEDMVRVFMKDHGCDGK